MIILAFFRSLFWFYGQLLCCWCSLMALLLSISSHNRQFSAKALKNQLETTKKTDKFNKILTLKHQSHKQTYQSRQQ